MAVLTPFLSGLATALRYVSIGKHNQGLFLNGRSSYSTIFGGLVTLSLLIFMVSYTTVLFSSITNRDNFNFETKYVDVFHWQDISEFNLGDRSNIFITGLVFYLDKPKFQNCEQVIAKMKLQQMDPEEAYVQYELKPGQELSDLLVTCTLNPFEEEETNPLIDDNGDLPIIAASTTGNNGIY